MSCSKVICIYSIYSPHRLSHSITRQMTSIKPPVVQGGDWVSVHLPLWDNQLQSIGFLAAETKNWPETHAGVSAEAQQLRSRRTGRFGPAALGGREGGRRSASGPNGCRSLVFDEGFPESGPGVRFLGNPSMETPCSLIPSVLQPLYPSVLCAAS